MSEEVKEPQEEDKVVDIHPEDLEDDNYTPPVEEEKKEEEEPPPTPTFNDDLFTSVESMFNEGLDPEQNNMFSFDKELIEKLPEMDIKDKRSMLVNSILDHVMLGGDEKTDKFVRSIIQASHEEGFDIEKHLMPEEGNTGVYKWEDHTTDENYKFAYSKVYGKGTAANLTDEEIEQEVSRADLGAKKAFIADFQKGEKEQLANAIKEREEYEKRRTEEVVTKYNESAKVHVDNLVKESKERSIFSGFFFSQADKEDYLKMLPEMLERKIVTLDNGSKYAISEAEKMITDISQNSQSIMDLLPFLYLVKTKKLDNYTTMLTQQVKEEFLNKLDANPTEVNPSGGGEKEVDVHPEDLE